MYEALCATPQGFVQPRPRPFILSILDLLPDFYQAVSLLFVPLLGTILCQAVTPHRMMLIKVFTVSRMAPLLINPKQLKTTITN